MSLHDEYARLTPFEIAFSDRDRFEDVVAAATAEAERRGVDDTDPDEFSTLAAVGDLLVEMHGEEVPRVELVQHGLLLFHSVHFARAGRPLYLLDAAATRALVRTAPVGPPELPSDAGYLQLPQHLFWVAGLEGGSPESVDGLFWTVSRAGRLHVLAIVGVRPDRAGFGALSLPDAPLAHAADWMHADIREGGGDFTSRLAGAELDDLCAVESAGEVFKLLARFFAQTATVRGTPEGPRPAPGGVGPRPSDLEYLRITPVP